MRRTVSLLLLILLSLNACAHWATMTVPVEEALAPQKGPRQVRLQLRDSSLVELRFALLGTGTVTGQSTLVAGAYRVIPIDSILSLQVRQASAAGMAVGAFLAVALVAGLTTNCRLSAC